MDQEYLNRTFKYRSGRLYWRLRLKRDFPNNARWRQVNAHFVDKEAGTLNWLKMWRIRINGKLILRCKIIWVMFGGSWDDEIAHKDGDLLNDKIENLKIGKERVVYKNNTSGYRGICRVKNKWRAYCGPVHIGYYDDLDEAVAARENYERTTNNV